MRKPSKQYTVVSSQGGRKALTTVYRLLNTNRGLTLLEIAISLAILTIALVTLANLFPIGLKASRRASNLSEASVLAQRVIENIKRAASVYDKDDYGIETVGGGVLGCTDGDGIGYFELVAEDTAPYIDEAEISPTPSTGTPNYFWKYQYPDMDTYAVITKENVDTDSDLLIDADKKLKLKIYVAVYWIENDRPRGDTFVTYIANPFYEKYR